jgi:CysZ protein
MSRSDFNAKPGFRDGFAAPWSGFRHMRRNPSLWPHAIAPVCLNLLITPVLGGLTFWAALGIAKRLHERSEGFFGWLLEIAAFVGLAGAVLVTTFVGWFLFQAVLCGFFYARLARAVERQLGTAPDELHDLTVRREITDGIRAVVRLLSINLALLFLHVIPVAGSTMAFVGGLYFDAWFFGMEVFQIPLSVRGQNRDALKAFARRHRSVTLGLGGATLLLSLIPILNSVLLTTSVAGAVLLRRRLLGEPTGVPPVLPMSPVDQGTSNSATTER